MPQFARSVRLLLPRMDAVWLRSGSGGGMLVLHPSIPAAAMATLSSAASALGPPPNYSNPGLRAAPARCRGCIMYEPE